MSKEDFLHTLATKGYDIGFGAKKNFASFDIINKLPSWAGFISLLIGITQIAYLVPFSKELSITLIFVGIAIIYLEVFKSRIEEFDNEGVRLTKIFNQTRDLYLEVKSDEGFSYDKYEEKYQTLMNDFYSNTVSKQVFMSQWYAHFKFFYEMQVDWIEKELKLKWFKDKIPSSLKVTLIIICIIVLISIYYKRLI
jgi:hypothetical protein